MEADPRTEQQLRDEIESLGKELADACREKAGRVRRPPDDAGHSSALLWRSMLDAMKDAVFLADADHAIQRCNRAFLDLVGKSFQEIVGRRCCEVVHGTFEPIEGCPFARVKQSRRRQTMTFAMGERRFDVLIDPMLDEEGNLLGAVHTLVDVTARRQAEDLVQRKNRALRVISQCNKALVKATEESALVNDLCRIIVQVGGYSTAWVAYPEQDEEKSVRVAGYSGQGEGFLKELHISWGNGEWGQGPTGAALRTGKPATVQDIMAHEPMAHWRDFSLRHNHASVISLPLRIGESTLGALTLFAPKRNAFDGEEVALLTQMADDLAYGIHTLRTRAHHARAEQKLLFDHALLKAQSHASIDGILVVNGKGEAILYNRRFGEMWNMPPELLAGRNGETVLAYACGQTKTPQVFLEKMKHLFAHPTEKARGEIELKDGRVFDQYTSALVLRDGTHAGRIWYFRDLTERKRAERKLKEGGKKLQRMMDGTIAAMVSAFAMHDPYTAGHEKRVADLACAIAAQMGMSDDDIAGIRIAAYLHDIGKIAVPGEILAKPGKITDNEFGIIKTHAQFGYDILKVIDFPWPVALTALQHHERLNGSGYPQGISGEKIIPQARIIAVADVVEALSSHRPYRPGRGAEAAMMEISENKGILYNPQAVDACCALFADKRFEFE